MDLADFPQCEGFNTDADGGFVPCESRSSRFFVIRPVPVGLAPIVSDFFILVSYCDVCKPPLRPAEEISWEERIVMEVMTG